MKILRNLVAAMAFALAAMVIHQQPISATGPNCFQKAQQCAIVPQGQLVFDSEYCEHDVVHANAHCETGYFGGTQTYQYGVCEETTPYGLRACGGFCEDPPPGSMCA